MDNIRYIHLFGDSLRSLFLWGSCIPNSDKIHKQLGDLKADHFGGVTFRVNHTRQNIVVAMCSLKDPYSRKIGRDITDYRAEVISPAPFKVILPVVHKSRNCALWMQQFAVVHSLVLWTRFGWPPDQFCINFVEG